MDAIPVKKQKIKHKCGCELERTKTYQIKKSKYHVSEIPVYVWNIVNYCKTHLPNFAKKIEKYAKK